MDLTAVTDFLKSIGDSVSSVTASIISWLSSVGANPSPILSKLITLLIFATAIFIIIKTMEKPVKWIIIILLGLVIAGVALSFAG